MPPQQVGVHIVRVQDCRLAGVERGREQDRLDLGRHPLPRHVLRLPLDEVFLSRRHRGERRRARSEALLREEPALGVTGAE